MGVASLIFGILAIIIGVFFGGRLRDGRARYLRFSASFWEL